MREVGVTLPDLLPPPRRVSAAARARLLANVLTVVGAIMTAVTSAILTVGLLGADLPGRWALARGTREAPGRLVRAESTHTTINGRRLYRYLFTYRTPDGAEHPGRCYSLGPRVHVPRGAQPPAPAPGPGPGRAVTVEYAPGRPEVARIKGMEIGPAPPLLTVLAGVFTLVGLACLAGGLADGRGKARLLAVGAAAPAEIVACVVGKGTESGKALSWDEYRGLVSARGLAPARVPGGPTPSFDAVRLTRVVFGVWVAIAVGVMFVGVALPVVMVVLIWTRRMAPLVVNGWPLPPALSAGLLLVCLAAWVAYTTVIIRLGRSAMRKMVDPAPDGPGGARPRPTIECRYAFTPAGAPGPVEGSATLALDPDLGPRRVVLYDPDRPGRSTLTDALPAGVRVSEFGDWEADGGLNLWLRAALCALMPLAGPLVGWAAWRYVPA